MIPRTASSSPETPSASSLNPTLLLAMQVAMQPHRSCLADASGRSLSFRQTEVAAATVAALLGELKIAAGARVLLLAPNGANAIIGLLGILRAGLQPVVAAPVLRLSDLLPGMTQVRPAAVIAENPAGGPPAVDAAMRLAAAEGSIRFVMGFGLDLPKGAIDLTSRTAQARPGVEPKRAEEIREAASILTLGEGGQVLTHSIEGLIGAAIDLGKSANLLSSDRVIATLPLSDGVGLAAGLIATLFAGAELAPLDAPNSVALGAALDTLRPVHLIWPARLSPAIAELANRGRPLRALIRRMQGAGARASHPGSRIRAETVVDVTSADDGRIIIEGSDNAARSPPDRRSAP